MASSSSFSYATFLIFACVAIMAATAPSEAATVAQLRLNGSLICDGTQSPAAPNVTVSLICGSQYLGTGVVLDANTSANGTVSGSVNIGPLTRLAFLQGQCTLVAPPQICPGTLPANATLGTSLNVGTTVNPPAVNVSPGISVGAMLGLDVNR